jgi:Ion channel
MYKYLGIIDPNGLLVKQPRTCFYFSIVTYTTLGYGDYKPSEQAQLFAASEAILGYILFGVFIGVLRKRF